jgi:hypothetical protein
MMNQIRVLVRGIKRIHGVSISDAVINNSNVYKILDSIPTQLFKLRFPLFTIITLEHD